MVGIVGIMLVVLFGWVIVVLVCCWLVLVVYGSILGLWVVGM